MKIIRYILSHGLLLVFLVLIGFAYYYRTQLFSDNINERIDGAVKIIVAKSRDVAEVFGYQKAEKAVASNDESVESTGTEVMQETVEQARQDVIVDTDTSVTTDTTHDEEAATESQVAEDESLIQNTEAAVDATVATEPQTSDETLVQADAGDTTSEQATAESDSQVDSDKQATMTTQQQLLNQARLAFQGGDAKKSVSLYQELSELDPSDPNIFGELGNVFYSQGKWKQAGEAYYQAASLLLDQGHAGQVNYLYRVIQGLDQESAEKLKAKLNQ